MRLEDQVAIVTGGGNGIGRAYCLRLAAEGARVAVADCDAEAAESVARRIRAAGAQALAVPADVSLSTSTEEMARKTVEAFGRIDILVNNAAIFGRIPLRRVAFWDLLEEEWDRMMAVNIKGAWLCTRAVVPCMRELGKGKIINQSSNAFHAGSPNFLHYVASRGAVIGMTRAMARELGGFNINVNCIAPGATVAEEEPEEARVEFCRQAVPRRAIQRIEYPADLVGALIFLASDDSDFITGQTIIVDGGAQMI